jgi:hypothetical protein
MPPPWHLTVDLVRATSPVFRGSYNLEDEGILTQRDEGI